MNLLEVCCNERDFEKAHETLQEFIDGKVAGEAFVDRLFAVQKKRRDLFTAVEVKFIAEKFKGTVELKNSGLKLTDPASEVTFRLVWATCLKSVLRTFAYPRKSSPGGTYIPRSQIVTFIPDDLLLASARIMQSKQCLLRPLCTTFVQCVYPVRCGA